MRIVIAAVGRLKDGPERELFERYRDRLEAAGRALGWGSVQVIEIPESRAAGRAARQSEEAERLLSKIEGVDTRIALDESGKSLSSEAFANLLRREREKGTQALAFLIGGPDGHGHEVEAAADVSLSLGAMTLPHMLARVVLAEQLYRAATILTGHPYHRG
jgi:23S rRNA (pseudouridine1915-N3)-methyltransferase